jgi:hypothetical protein
MKREPGLLERSRSLAPDATIELSDKLARGSLRSVKNAAR